MSTNKFLSIRRLIPQPVRLLMRKLYSQQFRLGFTPTDLNSLSPIVKFSKASKEWDVKYNGGWGGWIPAANHSHGYHGLLDQWWKEYGLGGSCLLISETTQVAQSFQKLFPGTKMVATDYYLNLIEGGETDVLWNLYEEIPSQLEKCTFGSVVSQATMEHLMDPVGVVRKWIELLEVGGHLYMHTHTPMYPYHSWPSDYLRYFPDWFRDLSMVVPNIEIIELYCKEGHAFSAYRKIRE